MSEQQSLMMPDERQPELLPTRDPVFGDLERRGDFTGDRLFQQRPDTYKAVVVLLGQGIGVIKIGKLLSVSPNTVMAVRDRERLPIEIVRDHLARVAMDGATLASEAMRDGLSAVAGRADKLEVKDLRDLAVLYGILVEKAQLLSGQPTARVQVEELKPAEHDAFNDYLRALKPAKVIHLEGETSGEKERPKTAVEPAASDLAVPAIEAGSEARTDEQSEGNPQKSS
jgi:hypothetical protein